MRYKTMQVHLLALAVLFATTAIAGQPTATQGHQVIFIDPVTGEVRAPTAAEKAELLRAVEQSAAIQQRSAGLRGQDASRFQWHTVRAANGVEARVSAVPEQLRSGLYAEPGPDGEYGIRHTDGAGAAAQENGP